MALEKATIDILRGSGEPKPLRVMFNPNEYSIERGNAYKITAIPGLGGPLIQFINGEARTLSMELFIDDYTDSPKVGAKSVEETLDDFAELLDVDRELHAPPLVRFVWGKLNFKAIVEKLSTKITLFRPDGTPARATLGVTFKEYRTLPERIADPRLQSADKTKRRVLVGEDSVWALAGREYGSALLWRTIAEANDLDDPRDASAGDWLLVPPLENRHESR
jgi:nucleoid-associated protein YgaU